MPGWTGAGYIIFNPDTGDGAYKISGGANGGFLLLVGFIILAAFLVISTSVFLIGLLTIPIATINIILASLAIHSFIKNIRSAADQCQGLEMISVTISLLVKLGFDLALKGIDAVVVGTLMQIVEGTILEFPEDLGCS